MYPYDQRLDDSPLEDDHDLYESEREVKGGKPSKGTPSDKRLKDNSDDGKVKPSKPFPGAAKPFKGGKS